MPTGKSELPEGTDHIVTGAGSNSTGGFVATSPRDDTGTARPAGAVGEKLSSQVRDQVSTLRSQATERVRSFADDGKARASGLLDDLTEVLNDTARSIDDKLGSEYGSYAHRAAGAVSNFSGTIREKSVEQLLDDTRGLVRRSPTIAIGIAAIAGFALMRVVKTGIDDLNLGRRRDGGTGTGAGNTRSGG